VCPIHGNGGAGQHNDLPPFTLMDLVNDVLNIFDRGDCEGRNGCVEIYVCGVLMEMGVWKVMMK
jgi:hypothetical protein